MAMSYLNSIGDLLRRISACCSVGVITFDMESELSPERQSGDELESGLCDSGWIPDRIWLTVRVVGRKS